jgi:hypothetical protein
MAFGAPTHGYGDVLPLWSHDTTESVAMVGSIGVMMGWLNRLRP